MTHEHEIEERLFSFSINPGDRGIYKVTPGNIKLMQRDHNSVRFYFKMPRYVNNHDMSLCTDIDLHYINLALDKTKKSEDFYPIRDMKVDTDDENYIVFSWLISGNATKYEGVLSFLISFLCVKNDGDIDYAWHTDKHITNISEGMNNSETVYEGVSDVLAAWEEEAVKNVTQKAFEAVGRELTPWIEKTDSNERWIQGIIKELENLNPALTSFENADKENAKAIENLNVEIPKLKEADAENKKAIEDHKTTYNVKVIELEEADAENKKAFEDHKTAYNVKVNELDQKTKNAIDTANAAQTTANLAQTAVNNAIKAANMAQNEVNSVRNSVDMVQDTANNAVEAANAAQETANNAVEASNITNQELSNYKSEAASNLSNSISEHNTSEIAHNDIRVKLTELMEEVSALLGTDEDTLGQISEMVEYINSNKDLINEISSSKVAYKDIVDNLITSVSNKPLSAKQGVVLKGLIDALTNNLDTHKQTYNAKIEELEAADKSNADNLTLHKETYDAKVKELEDADTENAKALNTHNAAPDAHSDIRLQLSQFIEQVRDILDSDDEDLNKMSEVVAYIKENKTLIDELNTELDKRFEKLENVDNTSDEDKPVSKEQANAIADAKKAGEDAQTSIENHIIDQNNPHGVTCEQIGASPTSHTHKYAASDSEGGPAISAKKLTTSAGDNKTPVYFKDGLPIACDDELYTHPTHVAYNSGLYKMTVDNQGHVIDAEKVTKEDITSLGIPEKDTTYTEATQEIAGLLSADDKKNLDNVVDETKSIKNILSVTEGTTEGLSYTLSADGTYYICSGIGTANITDIVIADYYNGLPVKEIDTLAFDTKNITSVVIGNCVEIIGDSAFSDCVVLKKVILPNSLITIGATAFRKCKVLERIEIPNSVTIIGRNAFLNCQALTIYCETANALDTWASSWNYSNRPVIWGYRIIRVAFRDEVTSIVKENVIPLIPLIQNLFDLEECQYNSSVMAYKYSDIEALKDTITKQYMEQFSIEWVEDSSSTTLNIVNKSDLYLYVDFEFHVGYQTSGYYDEYNSANDTVRIAPKESISVTLQAGYINNRWTKKILHIKFHGV